MTKQSDITFHFEHIYIGMNSRATCIGINHALSSTRCSGVSFAWASASLRSNEEAAKEMNATALHLVQPLTVSTEKGCSIILPEPRARTSSCKIIINIRSSTLTFRGWWAGIRKEPLLEIRSTFTTTLLSMAWGIKLERLGKIWNVLFTALTTPNAISHLFSAIGHKSINRPLVAYCAGLGIPGGAFGFCDCNACDCDRYSAYCSASSSVH